MTPLVQVLVAALFIASAAGASAANVIQTDVTIQGGRWQVGSEAYSRLVNGSGVYQASACIGHTHALYTPNRNLFAYPKNLGTVSSSQTNTPDTGWALPPGCAYATVNAQSYDKYYPADPASDRTSYICWTETNFGPFVPGTPPPDSGGGPESPIIFDLDGRGYKLTAAADGVSFDIRNDGKPITISWTEAGSTNAFLAMDRNGNGTIDNGSELFGNHTLLRSGKTARNGFEVLQDLDENHDYLLDANDPVWRSLLLWTDTDHDGVSSLDELRPVTSSAFVALETDYTVVGREDRWGNEFRYLGHLRLESGGKRSFFDVYLQTRKQP